MARPKLEGLSPQQQRFVDEFLVDLNATQAALRAGYGGGKNANSAAVQACKLLIVPKIQEAISQAKLARARKVMVTQERVLRELVRCGLANMDDYAEWKGQDVNFKDSANIKRSKLSAVKKITQTSTKDGGSFSIELHDKMAPLKLLAEHTGLIGKGAGNGDGGSQPGAGKSDSKALDEKLSKALEEAEG